MHAVAARLGDHAARDDALIHQLLALADRQRGVLHGSGEEGRGGGPGRRGGGPRGSGAACVAAPGRPKGAAGTLAGLPSCRTPSTVPEQEQRPQPSRPWNGLRQPPRAPPFEGPHPPTLVEGSSLLRSTPGTSVIRISFSARSAAAIWGGAGAGRQGAHGRQRAGTAAGGLAKQAAPARLLGPLPQTHPPTHPPRPPLCLR